MKKLITALFIASLAIGLVAKTKPSMPQEILQAKTITVLVDVNERIGKPEDRDTFRQEIEARLRQWGHYRVTAWEETADITMLVRIGADNGLLYADLVVGPSNRRDFKKFKPYHDFSQGRDPISWVLTRFEEAIDNK